MRVFTLAALITVVSVVGIASASTKRTHATTLNVLAWKGGPGAPANITQINAAFEAAHPDIKLNWTVLTGASDAEYMASASTKFAAGDAPDVVMLDPQKMRTWASQGFLADLSAESWVKKQNPIFDPFSRVGGKTYQIIQENIGVGLYVNLDLLKKAGIKAPPQNWPQFLEALATLKAKNINGFLFANKGGWAGNNVASMLATNTVYKQTPNWGALFNQGKRHFNPDWTPVVNQMRELFVKKLVDPKLMLGIDPWNAGLAQFKAGKWAFMIQGAWELTDFKANAKFHFAFMPFPGGPAGTLSRGFTFVGSGLAANAKSPNLAAAKQYLAFWSTAKALDLYDSAETAFATIKGVKPVLAPEAAPFVKAYTEGRTIVSPPQGWTNPNGEGEMITIFQQLFVDPNTSNAKILSNLDKAIFKKG
jgi:raffinose/stachyose/melibiose transport system substrate-binding protein